MKTLDEVFTKKQVDEVSDKILELTAEGFISVYEQKPPYYIDGKSNWVLAAWSISRKKIKVFANKIGTNSCTADYWKEL